MPRRSPLFAAAIVMLGAGGAALAQQARPVGKQGWRVQLPSNWQRERFDETYAGDQFASHQGFLFARRSCYALIDEHVGLLENEGDYRRAFATLDLLPNDGALRVTDEADWRRVTKALDFVNDGWEGHYRSELLVADGVALHVLCWAAKGDRSVLEARIEDLLDGIDLPGRDSDLAKGLQPTRVVAERNGVQLSFAVRPFVLRQGQHDDCILSFATADDMQGLRVWEMRGKADADRALDTEVRELKKWNAQYEVLRRAPRTIDGVACVELWAKIPEYVYRCLAVPIGGDRCLLVRHWSRGEFGDPRPDRDAVFASMRVQRVAATLALLPLPAATAPVRKGDAASRAWLAAATQLAEREGWVEHWVPAPDGSWTAHSWSEAWSFVPGKPPQSVLPALEHLRAVVPWTGGVVALAGRDEVWHAVPFAAPARLSLRSGVSALAAAAADLLYVSSESSPWWLSSRSELVRRTPDGEERVVYEFPFPAVHQLAVTIDGKCAIVVDRTRSWSAPQLMQIDLATGAQTRRLDVRSIDSFGIADDGWLMTGSIAGEPSGVWHLPVTGAPVALVCASNLRGVRLHGDVLTVVALGDGTSRLLAIERSKLPPLAPRHAITPARLRQVGAALLRERPDAPATRTEVDATLAALQRHAVAILGFELPTAANELDDTLANCRVAADLGADGRIVFTLLIAGSALAAGAEWVDAPGVTWRDWLAPAESGAATTFVLPVHPPSVLDGDEEYDAYTWSMADLVDAADRNGRRLLCGIDAAALAAQATRCTPAGFDVALHAADAKALLGFVRTAPANTALRTRIHERLTHAARWAELATFAREAAVLAEAADAPASPDDAFAALLAAHRLLPAGDAAASEAWTKDALAMAAAHPREPRIYLLLGEAFAARRPAAAGEARTCFERVLEIGAWGPVYEAAEAALRRLDAR